MDSLSSYSRSIGTSLKVISFPMSKNLKLHPSYHEVVTLLLSTLLSRVISSVVGEVQMAFVKGRQIIDGPLRVDEIISWAKLYKSVKWRNWIHTCLGSAFASVLINGSPAPEFKMEKCLRQGANMSRSANWYPLLERFQKCLSSLKAKALSFGCRLTLTKSILGSLGIYYFSTFKAPKMVISKLERVRRKFFWGGASDSNKIAWTTWDKVVSPLDQGGLGIRSLRVSSSVVYASNVVRSAIGTDSLNLTHDWTKLLRSEAEYDELLERESLVSNLHLWNKDDKWQGIRVYKFNLDCVANVKWVVELSFNARLLSSTSIYFSRLVNFLEVKHFISTSVKEIDIVQLGIVSQVGLKLLLRSSSVSAPPHKLK
ncbi:hypothetical protein Tco_1329524 [Tanacetum coccineum]